MPHLMITGASGTLGQHLARQALAAGWQVTGTYHTARRDLPIAWQALDVGDATAVEALVASVRPNIIIHTAYRQRGPGMWTVTALGAAHVARASAHVSARLVHLSSDMVFDGSAAPYLETAPPSPISAYGAAKAAAETVVAALAPDACIVRTSLIISHQPLDQHQQLVLDVLDGRQAVRFFTDEVRCPIAAEDLATAVLTLATGRALGIVNIAGAEAVSRYELARLIAGAHQRDPDTIPAGRLIGSGLNRPPDLRLDLSRAAGLLGAQPRSISAYLTGART